MADLALGVRERVGDLVARRRLLEGHLVRVDGVEREADVDADVAHAARDVGVGVLSSWITVAGSSTPQTNSMVARMTIMPRMAVQSGASSASHVDTAVAVWRLEKNQRTAPMSMTTHPDCDLARPGDVGEWMSFAKDESTHASRPLDIA